MKKQKIIHRKNDLWEGRSQETLNGALEEIETLSRRRLFAVGAAAMGAAFLGGMTGLVKVMPRLYAGEGIMSDKAVKTGQFIFPRLQFTVTDNTVDRWNVYPMADVILRKKLAELTNINVSQQPKVVRLMDFEDMCRNPFVFMTSEGYFLDGLKAQEKKNMREFFERGGFIFADDCVWNQGTPKDRFFSDYNKLLNEIFPDNPMRKIPYDHEIFHLYFDFDKGAPHLQGVPHGSYGLFEPGTGRIVTFNSPGDLHCGWTYRWWGKEKSLSTIKMGINVILYFLSH